MPITHLSLVLAIVAGSFLAIYLVARLIRHLRSERRHDQAKDCACQNIKLLADGVVDAEVKTNGGEHPKTKDDLGKARAELLRLSQLRDTYYEEGATPEEWDQLSADAESAESTARGVVNTAAEDQLQGRLAKEAMERVEAALAAVKPINGVVVELAPTQRLLVQATNRHGAHAYKDAREAAEAAMSSLRWAEARALLESAENELDGSSASGDARRAARNLLTRAWELYNSSSDIDEVNRLAAEASRLVA